MTTRTPSRASRLAPWILLASFLFPRAASAAIVINEVLWAGSDVSTSDEWLELACFETKEDRNNRNENNLFIQSMSGWTLSTLGSDGLEHVMVKFASGSLMESGSYLLISNFAATESRLMVEPDIVTTDVSLPNTKLRLRLRDASGKIVDEVDDAIGDPFAGRSTAPKASMERIAMSLSGALKTSWRTATESIGFDEGAIIYGTPTNGMPTKEEPEPEPEPNPDPKPEHPQEEGAASSVASSTQISEQNSSSIENSSISLQPLIESESGSVSSQFFSTSSEPLEEIVSSSFSSQSSSSSQSLIIHITELLPDPVGSDEAEWVELLNAGSGSVDIAGWSLKSGTSVITIASGQDSTLEPNDRAVIAAGSQGLRLPNAGGTVQLLKGGEVMDALLYPGVIEGVSIGREPAGQITKYCRPTPGLVNEVLPPEVEIDIQSGQLTGVGKTTVNVQAKAVSGVASGARCRFDFGDGSEADTCNPPSQTYGTPGDYELALEYTDYCSNTVIQTAQVSVVTPLEKETESANAPQSVARPSCTPSIFAGVVISEFLPDPEGDDEEGEWIELANKTAAPAPLCGWTLDDEEGGSTPYSLGAFTIPAGGWLVLKRTDTGIALNNEDDAVRLTPPAGSSGKQEVIEYGKVKSGQAFALTSTGGFLWTATPTPGKANMFGQTSGQGAAASSASSRKMLTGIVKNVRDGELIVDTGSEKEMRVRFANIGIVDFANAPLAIREIGLEAMNFISALLINKKIELQIDTEERNGSRGFVNFEGKDVGILLLEKGYAWIVGDAASDAYREAEAMAKKEKKGIWSLRYFERYLRSVESSDPEGDRNLAEGSQDIVINEVVLSSDDGEWVELWNRGVDMADLTGWTIDDGVNEGSKPHALSGVVLEPGELKVITGEDLVIKLNDDGDILRLVNSNGDLMDELKVPSMKKGYAYTKIIQEGEESWCISTSPTPGGTNLCTAVKAAVVRKVAATAKKVTAKKASSSKAKSSKSAKSTPAIYSQLTGQVSEEGGMTSSSTAMGLGWIL